MSMLPNDPIAAVTSADPYPYYRDLVAHRPCYHDERYKLWVAASADAVTAVLTSDLCRVRPRDEPVPSALLGSAAADIFQHLVRMNDGERHGPLRQAVQATLESIDLGHVAREGRQWARMLLDEPLAARTVSRLAHVTFRLPVYVIASLLGVPQERLEQTALWIGDFVRCIAPASTPSQIEQGKIAAGHLLDLFHSLLDSIDAGSGSSLLALLSEQMNEVGCTNQDSILANGIGFLSQSYEATAGLICNTLAVLASHPEVFAQVKADSGLLRQVIEEVVRFDPSVHNTRRFLARNGTVAGQAVQKGDAVLVLLAAANADPAVNAQPERFDPSRKDRCVFTFGVGIHACPGEVLAKEIALAGCERLIASQFVPENLLKTLPYHPSANVRIALPASEMHR